MLSSEHYISLINSISLLNSKLHIEEILDFVMKEITRYLNADRSTLYILDRQKNEIWSVIVQGEQKLKINLPVGKGVAGWVAETGKMVNIADAYKDSRFNPEVDQRSGYRTASILCVPIKAKNDRLMGVLQVLNKKNGIFNKEDELFASLYAEHIAIAIQNALYLKQALKEQKLAKELKLAEEIQRFFEGFHQINVPELQISSSLENAFSLGGDFFTLWKWEDRLYFIVADAMGKGVGGALTMATLIGIINYFKETTIDLKAWVDKLNTSIYNMFRGKRFITAIVGYISLLNFQIRFIRCGHVYPLIIRPLHQNSGFKVLKSAGPPLGIQKNALFEEKKLQLLDGDIFFCCSDGLTERNRTGEMLQPEEIGQFLLANHYLAPEILTHELIRMATGKKDKDEKDDQLVFMIKKRSTL